jgi:hypothetical protein
MIFLSSNNDTNNVGDATSTTVENAHKVKEGNTFFVPDVFRYVYVMEDDDDELDDDNDKPTINVKKREVISYHFNLLEF